MLSRSDLKNWVGRDLTRADKLLIVLSTFDKPCSVKMIVEVAAAAGLREVRNWNVSQILSRIRGKAVNSAKGWELTSAGKVHLETLGIADVSESIIEVAKDLRAIHSKISDEETRDFVGEAIRAFELELYRSAVVMSWLAAVDVLKKTVVQTKLNEFNVDALKFNSKWKPAATSDDLGNMKEADFLDRISNISLVGKNVKEELKKRLDLRNACGHPNSFALGRNAVAHHIEILLLNVFTKFI